MTDAETFHTGFAVPISHVRSINPFLYSGAAPLLDSSPLKFQEFSQPLSRIPRQPNLHAHCTRMLPQKICIRAYQFSPKKQKTKKLKKSISLKFPSVSMTCARWTCTLYFTTQSLRSFPLSNLTKTSQLPLKNILLYFIHSR